MSLFSRLINKLYGMAKKKYIAQFTTQMTAGPGVSQYDIFIDGKNLGEVANHRLTVPKPVTIEVDPNGTVGSTWKLTVKIDGVTKNSLSGRINSAGNTNNKKSANYYF